MKNTIYILVSACCYFLATYNCQAQYNPVDYDLYIYNDVYADNVDTAATTGNIIAINTIFSGGIGNYFASGTTLQEGFTVENGGSLFLSVPITGKRSAPSNTQLLTKDNLKLQVYPNPTVKFATISLVDEVWNSNVSVEVYAINSSALLYSKRIQQKDASRISLDISTLPKGIYVVKVYEDKGGKSFTQKLIKN